MSTPSSTPSSTPASTTSSTTSGTMSLGSEPREQSAQRLRTVFTAELGRTTRQGGLRRGLIGSGVVGLLTGVLTLVTIRYLSSGSETDLTSTVPVTAPVEASTSIMALVFALCVVVHVGRVVQGGSILTTLVVLPNRRLYFAAHTAAVAVSAFVGTFLVAAAVLLAATAATGFEVGLGSAVVGVLAGSCAAALLAVLASSVAMLLNSAIAAVLVVLGWWVILPLVLAVVGGALPAWLAQVTSVVADVTPTKLLVEATTVSSLSTQGAAQLVAAVGGLAAWAVVVSIVSGLVLERRSY